MTTPRYPDRDAMICRMWRQGKAIELIQAAVEKLPGGAGLKARRLANIAGQYKVQRPSWYMRDVVATNGKKGAQNGGWRPEEDALAEELHRAGASARQIGVELGKLTQGRRRGPSSVRRRLLALELITEAAAPPPEVLQGCGARIRARSGAPTSKGVWSVRPSFWLCAPATTLRRGNWPKPYCEAWSRGPPAAIRRWIARIFWVSPSWPPENPRPRS